jgi:hypothetical protein
MLASVFVTFALELITEGRGVRGVPSLIVGIAAGAVVMLLVNSVEKRASSYST